MIAVEFVVGLIVFVLIAGIAIGWAIRPRKESVDISSQDNNDKGIDVGQ